MNRRDLLLIAAASPAVGLPTIALASVPIDDPVLALVSEWNTLEASINADPFEVADTDPRWIRHREIERAIINGAAPTTLAGAFAALSFARREIDPHFSLADYYPRSARVVFDEDPASGLAVAMIDTTMTLLTRMGS